MKRWSVAVLVLAAISLGMLFNVSATAADTAGKFRVGLAGAVGSGFSKPVVGTTTSGEKVTLSGGGGIGGEFNAGYGISRVLDAEASIGFQQSELSEDVSNASGTFKRSYLLATLKYKIPVSDSAQVRLGGGIGYYMSPIFDFDARRAESTRTIIKYDNAIGFHLTGEFERMINTFSITIGGKYYNVSYNAKSVKIVVPLPTSGLKDEFRNYDGSGFDVTFGVNKYF